MSKATLLLRLSLLLCLVTLTSCATGEAAAGQGDNNSIATAWNAKASWLQSAYDGTTTGGSDGGVIPLMDKDGNPIKDGNGNVVFYSAPKGLRDINFFFGDVDITASTTSSGSTEGTNQTLTPSTQTNPDVTLPVGQ